MDHSRHHSNGISYSNLFNLEPLMNFQLPRPDGEDDDNSGNSCQDDSTSSKGQGDMLGYSNGRRKRTSVDADSDEEEEGEEEYGTRFSEEQYRSMLSEHAQKYRRVRLNDPLPGMGGVRMPMPAVKHSRHNGSKSGKYRHDSLVPVKEETRTRDLDRSPEYLEEDFESEYGGSSRLPSALESSYLDIGEGITYRIPPTYDRLATILNLPTYSDIKINEYFLKGTLDLRSLAAFVAGDKRFEARNRGGMAEPQTQYESLQARLKALSATDPNQKFSLVVSDLGPDTIPEGAAGRIRRSIMSESGTMQVYYVKVLEKGDTYEIIERSLPKKLVVKKDPSAIEKEEMDKIGKIWVNIVRRDIPKHHRAFTTLQRKQMGDAKRFSEMCQREVKLKVSRSIKLMRGAAIRTKKLSRDMLLFWKRVDREQAEQRKKDEKEAAERLKREQELREAKRQEQSLNFLISQTELYSHFMQNKSIPQSAESLALVDSDSKALEGTSALEDIDEEDIEEAKIRRQAAMEVAQRAVSEQQKITNNFDTDTLKLRQAGEATVAANDSAITTNIDLLNPSTMPTTSSVQTPELFKGSLKDYQLKGLQWLVNCYEKGLNGILADEMGLGKTIQAMAFLAHLAEEKDIWGPFLVVAPSSVLNNWADEISRFCPDLKTLPYWGGLPERNILRKNINPKRLYRRDAGFHILITSYQLIISDEKYLRRVKWQYMVLDEAQAIKSSNSIRWKTLLSFNCRNRLLLTGTPIQNNMAELWALLHFIMPTLFNSHEQFNEWFSKGIEGHAEHGGTLNEHQLNRLHAVLKPFMLRRVKKDVITEMTSKTEVKVLCKLSSRQQAFYQAIKNKISLAEFFDSNRGHLNEKKIVNLMNIVIQLRKVCNHPELFERNEGSSYLYFSEIPNSLLPPPFGEMEDIHYSGEWNPIVYKVPKLIHEEIVRNTEMPCSVMGHSLQRNTFERLFNIFSPDNIYHSTVSQCSYESYAGDASFGFTRLVDLSPVEVSFLAKGSLLERLLFSVIRWDRQFVDETLDLLMDWEGDDLQYNHLEEPKMRAVSRMLLLPRKSEASILRRKLATGPGDAALFEPLVISHQDRFISNFRLLRSSYAYIPQARAPPINIQCSDRSFAYQMLEELHNPWAKKQFLGFARTSEFNGPRMPCDPHYLIQEIDTESSVVKPVLQLTYRIFGSSPPVRSFDPAKMLTDSGKLQTLDILLKRLRAENHRVLLFAQMTKMLNIIEDYMNYRKYKYLRLDGSSNINDRRDMVRDFQHRSDIFVFLLSTRAGGLGINLTAADTVIFYESDWNPTLDLQAMDRAHRLGQTKEVTVYRLICKETVEEKILQRASQKNTVQQLVMTGGNVQGDLMKPEDVFSLIMDDSQLEKMREIPLLAKERQKKKRPSKGIRVDADGVVSLEDFENPASQGADNESAEQHNVNSNKKRKSKSDDQTPKSRNPPKSSRNEEVNESIQIGDNEDHIQQRPTRSKRPKKSVNENLEPALNSSSNDYPQPPYDDGLNDHGGGVQEGMLSHSRSPMS
ncbi:DNA helicase INO80-like [Iris pallida]|uniref:Chromatin-remodeling ATPase INO80 n=1 Tax=Iris pallida TaxID=29817 RepID=A0AAX6GT16_IRIPA|nr:DNA helicase INO80-like [Iris pallida]KAJ6838817.1 DNA helicase INO80-like [Iris pallida]